MHINDVLNHIHKRRGLGSSEQCYAVLYGIVRAFNVTRVVEIGTHLAASTITICQAILDNGCVPEVWTIDNWAQAEVRSIAKRHLQMAKFDGYVTMLTGNSVDVLPELFPNIGQVDLVFIDGDHDPDAVQRDIEACSPHSSRLVMHDTPQMTPYLWDLKDYGWDVMVFPTVDLEGDGKLVGISLAVNEPANRQACPSVGK